MCTVWCHPSGLLRSSCSRKKTSITDMVVLALVHKIRKDTPLLGTRKLFYLLESELAEHGMIKMGRDQLFDLLGFHGLLIRRRKRIVKTTNSHHWLKGTPT